MTGTQLEVLSHLEGFEGTHITFKILKVCVLNSLAEDIDFQEWNVPTALLYFLP